MGDEELVDTMIEEALKESFKKNGIEGTEEVVTRVYKLHPQTLERFLKVYRQMLGVKK